MTDVAALNLSVDSSDVVKAANDLDKFSAASKRAGAATGAPTGSIAKLVTMVQAMDSKLGAMVRSLERMTNASKAASAANDNMAGAAAKASGAIDKADAHVTAYTQHLAAAAAAQKAAAANMTELGRATERADSHVDAYRRHLEQMVTDLREIPSAASAAASAIERIPSQPSGGAPTPSPSGSNSPYYGASNIEATGQAAQLASHQAQNLVYQLNDVFVSLASGQKPMMVFIQQGSQIGQIYSQAGLGMKGFLLALANTLGLLKSTTAATEALALKQATQAATSIAAADAQAQSNVRAAETNIAIARAQQGMAATATEAAAAEARLAIAVDALARSQAEAAITARALAKAQEEQAAAAAAARGATTTSLTATGAALAAIVAVLALATAGIAALSAQANDDSGLKKYSTAMGYTRQEVEKLNAVTVTWGDTAKAVFQVGLQRIASALGVSTKTIKEAWNSMLDALATGTRATIATLYAGFTALGYQAKRVFDNIKAGKIESPITTAVESWKTAYGDAQKFMDDTVKQARANARDRQAEMAKGFYDAPSAKTPAAPKQERNPWTDLLQDADRQQRALEQAGDRIGKTGMDLDLLTAKQNLFNQALDAGIPITEKGTIALNAQGLELQRRATIMAQTMQDNRIAEFNANLTRSFEDQMAALRQEAVELTLTGSALYAYRYEMEQLNAAKRAGLELDPQTLQNIKDQAAAYAEATAANDRTRQAIDQQRQAMEFNREITKGFFTDLVNGVRQGESIFKSFEKAISNAIDRIIDKMLEMAVNQMFGGTGGGGMGGGMSGGGFGGGFGGGAGAIVGAYLGTQLGKGIVSLFGKLFADGGAFGTTEKYALGGTFGGAHRFADGGAFTNSILNSPTLFKFANGTKLGVAGEAGPEAVMPLRRGPDGKLGVHASGGGGGGGNSIKQENNITNHYKIEGAVMPDTIMGMVRQGGEATYNQVKRDLQMLLQQLDTDGGFAT